MSAARKLYRVAVEAELNDDELVEAASAEEAESSVRRDVESSHLGLVVTSVRATEVPYVRPEGTDRWAEGAAAIRFAEDRLRWFSDEGAWWWSNGHAALKCALPGPQGVAHPDALKISHSLEALVGDHARREVTFGFTEPERLSNGEQLLRAKEDPRIAVNVDYLVLVTRGFGTRRVRWMAATRREEYPWEVPVLAFDGDEIVAVVMGIRA